MGNRFTREHESFARIYKQWAKEKADEEGLECMITPDGNEKLSDNIVRYAQPLLAEFFVGPDDFENIVTIAIIFWNFSLDQCLVKDWSLRCEFENDVMRTLAHPPFMLEPDEALNLINDMEKYWLKHFKNDLRMVTDKKFFHGEEGVHFSVISKDLSLMSNE